MATVEREVKTKQDNKGQGQQAQTVGSPFPVRKRLATPTDLSSDAVESVTTALNHLVANAFALYVKYKNFHWHLATPHFRDYHLMFDEHADQVLESIDPMAERVRRIGGTTIRSVGHITELQNIGDDNQAYVPAEKMVAYLLRDNRQMAQELRAAMELADQKRDHPTANLLQEILDETEKRIWFLYEVSMGEDDVED